jgi:ADP-ribose pyrophosphatase YjhB (NUDIX family)
MALERKITARGIIVKDGKLFAQKLHTERGINTFWSTPGGKLDPQEPIERGAARELLEECGVTAKVGRLLFVQQFGDETREFIEFFFHVENPDDFLEIDLESTTHGVEEIAEHGFIDPRTEHVLPAFLRDIDIQEYIDTVKPVLFHVEI